MTSTDLRFDEQVIDTSLAKEYLKQNSGFHSKGFDDIGDFVYDSYGNKIFLSEYVGRVISKGIYPKVDLSEKYLDLSEKILKNIDLFCQLEYLLRKKPIEQTKNIDLKLIVQNLIYHSSFQEAEQAYISEIVVTYDTPLASLGCIAQTVVPQVVIVSTKETAAICSLFVELCHEAGLQGVVYLMLVSDPPVPGVQTLDFCKITDMANGCVGIITEKADVDSAVDTFLYSSSHYPWYVRNIFVQECIMNRFMKSLEWKTKKPSGDPQEHLKSCTSVRVYEDKRYLFEFAGNYKNVGPNSVIIEAYRTNKELIALIATMKPFFLSLWSSNIAESNEISNAVNSNIVWINDLSCFDGPPIASQSFYSLIHRHLDSKKERRFPETDRILKIRESWLKLDIATRYMKIRKIWAKLQSETEEYDVKLKYNLNNATSVGNKVCMVTRHPDEPLVKIISECIQILDYLNYIVDGGAVIFISRCSSFEIEDEILKYYNALVDVNAPVAFIRHCVILNLPYGSLWYNTKAIWTSIGTIFAN